MIVDLKIPAVAESVTEVNLAQWLKKDGEVVSVDQELCSIESDKATLEIASPATGKLSIVIPEGETVAVGTVVAKIDTSVSAGAAATPAVAAEAPKTAAKAPTNNGNTSPIIHASPAASKILSEKGIATSAVSGTGKNGIITKEDAMNAKSITNGAHHEVVAKAPTSATVVGNRDVKVEKMTSLRKTISKRLVLAKNSTAMLTTFNEIDMKNVMDLRSKYKEMFKEKHEVGLGFMSFFTKACTVALKEFPGVNAQIREEEIIYHNYADVGIAVSTPKGLVVPIVRDAQDMSLAKIEKSILELAKKARDGKLTIEEMQNGTFTITNGGVFGSMLSTPIINIPQSAILGMHNIVERPVAVNGQVEVRPVMYVALSYDHRIIDGRESVGFLKRVKELIEDPQRLLLEV